MAIFNAWCDRIPVIVLGATGPVDAAKRRPWIDWIHTARDQGAIVRNYTKWDDQPASPAAAREALMRATWIANTAPMGPVYINLDAEMQEARLAEPLAPIDPARFMPQANPGVSAELLGQAAAMLKSARHPVILMGRVSRSLGGALRAAFGQEIPRAKIINVSADFHIHNGWSMDYEMLPPVDLLLPTTPDEAVPQLVAALGGAKARKPAAVKAKAEAYEPTSGPLRVDDLARSLKAAVGERAVTLTHLPLSWNGATWPFRHPLDYIGSEGGGGVGGGPGVSVGAALALKGSGRLPIAICGDGDFCMSATALWTAVHYRIPLLVVVCNNRSFFNDELHQERVARIRNRPPENRWIGQRISDPDIDCAGLGKAQGAVGFDPVTKTHDLVQTFEKAIAAVEAGQVAVVDVRVEPGYSAVATAAMLRGTEKK
jgi:thiamine pyrophosphate-dependent acetolactate synthase large subunit-like protein